MNKMKLAVWGGVLLAFGAVIVIAKGGSYGAVIIDAFKATFGVDRRPEYVFELPIEGEQPETAGSLPKESAPKPAKSAKKKISQSAAPKKNAAKHLASAKETLAPEDGVGSSPKVAATEDEKEKEKGPVWCPWKTFGSPRGDILINEIAWMGTEESSDAEWMELKNVSGRELQLPGWQLQSKSGKVKIALFGTIDRGGIAVLERDSDDALPGIAARALYKGELRNTGEWLKLFDSDCLLVDEINAEEKWPGGSSATKKTLERVVGGEGWQTSSEPGGTPGGQNHAPSRMVLVEGSPSAASEIPAAAPREVSAASSARAEHVLIFEIRIAGVASDDDRVTLYNPGPDSVDISGWKLRKRTKSGSDSSIKVFSGEIGAGEYFIWANAKHPAGAQATSTQTLSADNSIALLSPEDEIEDAVAWGEGHVGAYKEGSAYPLNPKSGQILARKSANGEVRDTDNNAEDFMIE